MNILSAFDKHFTQHITCKQRFTNKTIHQIHNGIRHIIPSVTLLAGARSIQYITMQYSVMPSDRTACTSYSILCRL